MNRRVRTNVIQYAKIGNGYGGAIAVIYTNGELVTFANVDVTPESVRIWY